MMIFFDGISKDTTLKTNKEVINLSLSLKPAGFGVLHPKNYFSRTRFPYSSAHFLFWEGNEWHEPSPKEARDRVRWHSQQQ